MAKQLNVDLNVRANASEAKKSLQDLQKTLTQLTNMSMSSTTTGMTQAAQAAKELSVHLNKAINTDTGKLNLNALNSSLKASKTDLSELSSRLLSAGSSGQAAFAQLAQSIAAADRPLVTMGTHLSGFLTTLKNTARWQISSSILHGFMGSIQSAYSYAQDLNQSLNNIRIVTGQSVDQMAQFAEQANKAAKALSTTTTAYTDAALIYYQQGLTGKEVTDRTDVTIKMANVSRQSAEEVSSQMTAIWNNFADGSKELEYYADVITALGAATASSSDEIAEGLQKFASIADTVGLSYEKATAALATVVAETRQSADVVGTAFKTMFARLQGLSLGETLDDGVDLNKYSTALKTVGVDIIDAKGNLKDMDSILDETAEKWNTISEAQKVALAETVAGVRQYSQFMAIMENYDKILANQDLAAGSSGTLQEQADIYAQSWEAAQKRVKASLQSIYSDLIDDKFFIKLTDGFAKLLSGLDAFIDGIGGLKTLLIGISGFVLSSISGKIGPAINQLKINLTTMFQSPMQQAEEYSKKMQGILSAGQDKLGLDFSGTNKSNQVAIENANQLSIAKNKLLQIDSQLTPMEKQLYQQELDLIQVQQQSVQELANKVTEEQRNIEVLNESMNADASVAELEKSRASGLKELEAAYKAAKDAYSEDKTNIDNLTNLKEKVQELNQYKETTKSLAEDQKVLAESLEKAYNEFLKVEAGEKATAEASVSLEKALPNISNELKKIGKETDMGKMQEALWDLEEKVTALGMKEIPELRKAFQDCATADPQNLTAAYNNLVKIFKNVKIEGKDLATQLKAIGEDKFALALEKEYSQLKTKTSELNTEQQKLNQAYANFNPSHILSTTEAFSQLASVGMQTAMVITSIKSAFNALTSEDMSPLERITTLLMSIGMIVPSTIGILNSLTKVTKGLTAALAAQAIVEQTSISLEKIYTTEKIRAKTVDSLINTTTRETTAAYIAKNAVQAKLITQEQVETVVKNLKNIATEKGKNLTWQDIAATIASTTAEGANTSSIIINTAAKYANWVASELLNKSSLGLMATFIAFLVPLALVVAAVWGLVKAFQAAQAASPEGKLKAAQENAEKLKTALDEATQAANDLKSAFDTYDSVKEKLDSCTKGTQEWYEALRDVNDQVLDMIAKYPELAKYLETGPNGELGFKEGVEEVEQAYAENAIKAQGASLKADQQVREAQINVDKNNIVNTLISSVGGYGPNGGGGAEVSAATKILADNADELRGLTGDLLTSKISEILTSAGLSDSFAKSFASAIENNGLVDNIIDLSNAIRENSSIEQGTNQAMAASILAMNEDTRNSDYLSDMSVAGGRIYDQAYDEAYAGYIEDGKTAEEAATLAAADAFNTLNTEAANLAEMFSKLSESGDAADNALKDFLSTGTLDNTSREDFNEAFRGDYHGRRGEENRAADAKQIYQQIEDMWGGEGVDLDEEVFKHTGYASADALIEAYQEQIDNADIRLDSLTPEDEAAAEARKKAAELAQAEEEAAKAAEDAADKFDLEADILKRTSKHISDMAESSDELADSLKEDRKEATEIAKDLERYNKALKSVKDNQEKWEKALSSGKYQDYVEVASDMADAYGDLLDIDGSNLSDSFLQSADNLSLMEDAVNGVEGAYDELLNRAQDDMLAIKIDPQAEADLYNQINLMSDSIRNQIKDIEVGAELNDEGFLNELTNLVNAAGMTADEATDYLSSMGIDAEVVEDTSTATDTDEVNSIEASVSQQGTLRVPVIARGGKSLDFTEVPVEGVNYDLVKDTADKTKEQTGFALKVTSAKKSSGGGFKHSRSSGSGGGGSCFVAGTLVSLKDYYKKIEEIQPGDIVLSYNEQTMKNEYSEVLQTMIHNTTEEIYSLFIENEKLQVTGIHRFLITRNNKQEWIMASN